MKLGPEYPFGTQECLFGLTERECFEPATWHCMWGDDRTTNACDAHIGLVLAGPPVRKHPMGRWCDIAGSFFFTPDDPDETGRCYMGDVPSIRTREAVEAWLGVAEDLDGS